MWLCLLMSAPVAGLLKVHNLLDHHNKVVRTGLTLTAGNSAALTR
jgi:hypothetical protein